MTRLNSEKPTFSLAYFFEIKIGGRKFRLGMSNSRWIQWYKNDPFIFRFEMNNSEVCVYRDITWSLIDGQFQKGKIYGTFWNQYAYIASWPISVTTVLGNFQPLVIDQYTWAFERKMDNYVIYVSAELFAFEFWISLND